MLVSQSKPSAEIMCFELREQLVSASRQRDFRDCPHYSKMLIQLRYRLSEVKTRGQNEDNCADISENREKSAENQS